jgi:predicted RNA-binding protein YlxR (DUF448 family)
MRQPVQHQHPQGPPAEARKKPLRSCVACHTTADKRSLVRFVRTATGELLCDPTGRRAGRGAYLCGEQRCFELARKKRLFDRALRTKLSEADYERLESDYKALCDGATADAWHSCGEDRV